MTEMIRKILLVLTGEEKKKLGILMLLDIAVSIADIVFLALLLYLVNIYTTKDAGAGSLSFLGPPASGGLSLWLIAGFFLLFSLKNFSGFLVYRAQCRFLCGVASRISENKLLSYLEGAYSGYINVDSSVNIREISHDPTEFCQHVLGSIQQVITQTFLILLAITGIIIFNAKLFLLLLIILLPPVIGVFYLIRRKLRSIGVNARTSSERSLQHLQEALSGFVESNIYNKNEVFLDRYIRHQQQFNKQISDQLIVQGIPGRMIEIFALLGVVILLAINQWYGTTGNTAVITIGVFMAAAYKIIPGIVKILGLSGQINTYSFTVRNLAPADVRQERSCEAARVIRSVRFKNVRFRYGSRPILENLNWQIVSGEFVGITGLSGKGKTTILNLLLGFLDPDEGEIIMNDTPAVTHERQQYWGKISYVKQQPFLIHDTILHNITLNGYPSDEGKLKEVACLSGLTGLIDTFPEKWNKVIAENGKNISGGQRQRIAIARALYKNADMIILDEPFNELDEVSELSLLQVFKRLSQDGKLVILITHNKKSLSFCNKIISLDEEPS